jgi:hypothetical protein
MATISFAPGAKSIGLSAFQKLREYKRLHELQWDDSLMKDEEGKFIAKKKRGRQISNQKANSIADIAAVLGKIGTAEREEIGLTGTVEETSGESEETEDLTKVEVKWVNMLDAEFAETWSDNVVHDKLDWVKNNREKKAVNVERSGQEADEVSAEEKDRKQREYWAKLDKKREEWYLAQGKSLDEIPPRKIGEVKSQKVEKLSAEEKAEREQKRAEKERKQREYWAKLDKKREEWYLAQGKSLDEIPPRKNVVIESPSTPVQSEDRALVRAIAILKSRRLQQEKRIDQQIAAAEADLAPLLKVDQQAEYWAELDKKRQKWYLGQGKSLDEISPRQNAARLDKSTVERILRLKKKKLVIQTRRNQEIAIVEKLVQNDAKMHDFWDATTTLSPEEMAETAEEETEENDGPFWTEVTRKAQEWYASQEEWTPSPEEVESEKLLHQEEQEAKESKTIEVRNKGAPKKRPLSQKDQEAKEAKQKAYWAEIERKRIEWYAKQGKTTPEKGYERGTL